MINTILKDSTEHPELFHWFGALNITEIERWERDFSVSIPEDLKLLWNRTGGGDLFESETILQPFGVRDDDLVCRVSEMFWKKGLPQDHYIFHKGMCLSTFSKSGKSLTAWKEPDIIAFADFPDLDNWYSGLLRSEYAQRYGLVGGWPTYIRYVNT